MYFAYDLYKPVETGVQTVGRRVQTVQTMREENKARTSISFDLGLYGLYMSSNSLYTGLYSLYTRMSETRRKSYVAVAKPVRTRPLHDTAYV